MSALIAVAAALGLVGLGMLVSPEMGRLRSRMRRRKLEEDTSPEPLFTPAPDPEVRPSLRVIHGDGGTVVPFRPRQAETFTSTLPPDPRGEGPDAA